MTEFQEETDWKWKDIDWKKATPADIEKVIQNGGDVNDVYAKNDNYNFRDNYYVEYVPLDLAVRAKNVPVVRYLLEHNANPNVVLASRHYHWGKFSAHDYPLLSMAISSKNQEIIDLFFEHNVDPYAFDITKPKRVPCTNCNTSSPLAVRDHPLMLAIKVNNLKLVKKITSDPYKVPEELMKEIESSIFRYKEDLYRTVTDKYWDAFVDRETRNKRIKLRRQLYKAEQKNDIEEKRRIISQLTTLKSKDSEDLSISLSKLFADLNLRRWASQQGEKQRTFTNRRDFDAHKYLKIRGEQGTAAAFNEREIISIRRDKELG